MRRMLATSWAEAATEPRRLRKKAYRSPGPVGMSDRPRFATGHYPRRLRGSGHASRSACRWRSVSVWLELELPVEMVLDDRLVAAGDEDEMLDARLARLIDHVLDQPPIDDRQHLLRHGLGGGKNLVPSPATGKTALRMGIMDQLRVRGEPHYKRSPRPA